MGREHAFGRILGAMAIACVTMGLWTHIASAQGSQEPLRSEDVSAEDRRICTNASQEFRAGGRITEPSRLEQCLLVMRSRIRYNKGDFPGAIEDATKALQIKVTVHGGHYTWLAWQEVQGLGYAVRGSAHFRLGDYAKAVADATSAIEKDPRARYYAFRAEVYRRLGGHEDKALADARRAIEIDPKLAPEHVARGIGRPKIRILRHGVEPTHLTIPVGAEVEWDVEDPERIRLDFDPRPGLPAVPANLPGRFMLRFEAAGTFDFHVMRRGTGQGGDAWTERGKIVVENRRGQ